MINYPKDFLELLNSVKTKRARTVIDHILKNGYITSQELKDVYGYNHPPRAIRDVREYGIPIITYGIPDKDGKKIAAYRFGDPSKVTNSLSKSYGRTLHSSFLKHALVEKYSSKCFIYLEEMPEAKLQVDHRIPYEIAGEHNENDIDYFMLLSPSANRTKSLECQHCQNWSIKDVDFCKKCFWAYPENYQHIAGISEKVVFLTFTNNEIDDYNKLIDLSKDSTPQATIKRILHNHLN